MKEFKFLGRYCLLLISFNSHHMEECVVRNFYIIAEYETVAINILCYWGGFCSAFVVKKWRDTKMFCRAPSNKR